MTAPRTCLLLALLTAGLVAAQPQQNFDPPPPNAPDDAARKALVQQCRKLFIEVESLRRLGVADPTLAEVEVYLKGVDWILKYNEFFHRDSAAWTREAIERGLERAAQAEKGQAPWLTPQGRSVVRAYRSRVDG